MLGLLVFSGFTLNLLLHGGLGLGSLIGRDESQPLPFPQLGILWLSVVLLWAISSYGLFFLPLGFLEYTLLFPFSALACMGLERLMVRVFPTARDYPVFNPATAYDGLVVGSLLMSLHLAGTLGEACILSLGFAVGTGLSAALLKEIRIRSALELVPQVMQGRPLALLSAGLVSLLFSALGLIFFDVLGLF
ncbi:MAG: hypothetical protein LBD74_00345 [Spirochaetaceae bacterium]|jgi:electron transport complex protein RnfA|nr:hypothetical protein [Spirochaetaceae bacterium]